ncbi:MAG TPA: NAD(P)/FAD-dependent oxidoreductase [Kofleriaceae bacterium]|jgi:NADH dehydrogenase|nr:NAD(P)/FAD-dependent oxidoreductase [Kofleriaceae bacterium]
MPTPHVVVIGGGFGGLAAVQGLARAPVNVTLIDRRNHHLFQPLLYQVATAALNPSDIAYPIRGVLAHQRNARVLLASATTIDTANRRVALDDGGLEYDYLVVATGATHSYFGHDDWAHTAPGLKSVEDALEIRRRIFLAYEAAEREADPARQREWLMFVVVGGGPTGVELAGALGEIGLQTLAHDFRTVDPTQVRVALFESKDRILGTYPDQLSAAAQRALARRHVDVRLRTQVIAVDPHGVTVRCGDHEEHVGARTVLWAAGVRASSLAATLGVPRDRSGRVEVLPDLSVPGHPEVFVIGDLAKVPIPGGGEVPGVAQGALQGGRYVARVIAADARARNGVRPPRSPFRYHDKGNMATVGRSEAVVVTKHYAGHGLIAWLLWWAVHIAFLIGFRSRLLVMFHWAWSWLTFKRGARLITGTVGALPPVRSIRADGQIALPPPAAAVALDEPCPPPA